MLRITPVKSVYFENIKKQIKPVFILLNSLVERVCKSVASFFSKFNPYQNVRGFFSEREISLFQTIHTLKTKQSFHRSFKPHKREFKEFKIQEPSLEIEILENKKQAHYISFDESIEDFRTFLREFCVLFIDTIFDSKLESHVESAKNLATTLPNMIKSFATLLIEVGDKAAKPIFQKLSKQKAHTIDPALKKIFSMLIRPDSYVIREDLSIYLKEALQSYSLSPDITVDDYIQPILQYVTSSKLPKSISDFCLADKPYDFDLLLKLQNEAVLQRDKKIATLRKELYEQLKLQLDDEFKTVSKQDTDEDWVESILNWLILSDHSIALAEVLDPLDLQKEAITDQIFEKCLEFLVNRKIDQYSLLVERTLKEDLKEISLKTLQINAERIADFFSEKVALLITSSSFSNTFDNLIEKVIFPHIKGVNEAQKLKNEHSILINKAENALELSPKDSLQVDIQSKAYDYLDWIKSHGSQETFLQNIYLSKYQELPICTKNISGMIDQEIKDECLDIEVSTRTNKEKAVFSEIADNILELIIPSKRANRDTEEYVDPLIQLWERLYFPEELQEIMKNLFKTTEEFINKETSSLFEIVKTPALEVIKNIFKLYTREILKKQLIKVVELSFSQLADPNNLSELFSLNLLPVINKKLIQLLIGQYFAKNLSKFSPYLHTQITDSIENHDLNLHNLQAILIKDFKSSSKDLNFESFYLTEKNDSDEVSIHSNPLSEEDLLLLTKPLILNYEEIILTSNTHKKPFDKNKISVTEIKSILQNYFQSSSQENNNVIFGEIFSDIVFKSGQFPHEALINYFIKDSVSNEITSALKPFRANHRYLVDIITSSLKSTFLNKNYLEDLISDKPTIKAKYVQEKLKLQVDMTASLAHRLILGIVQQKGTLTSFAVKKYLTDKSEMLSELINNIFNNLFKNYLINANLITAFSLEVFRTSCETT